MLPPFAQKVDTLTVRFLPHLSPSSLNFSSLNPALGPSVLPSDPLTTSTSACTA